MNSPCRSLLPWRQHRCRHGRQQLSLVVLRHMRKCPIPPQLSPAAVSEMWIWSGFSSSLAETMNHSAKALNNSTTCLKQVKNLLLTPLIIETGPYFCKLVQLPWKLRNTGLDSFYEYKPIATCVMVVAMRYPTHNSTLHLQKLIVCRKEWQRNEKITWTKAFVLAPSG